MPKPTLFSIKDTPTHPDNSRLYAQLGIEEVVVDSMRKACNLIKKQQPDFVIAEFIYGYGNNYAGVNISNLDVFLHAKQRYAPMAKIIVLVDKSERQYVDKLLELFPIHGVLTLPASTTALTELLT